MSGVRQQAVRDIDAGGGPIAQLLTESQRRRRAPECAAQGGGPGIAERQFTALHGEPGGGVAEGSAHPQGVTDSRAAATQSGPGGRRANNLHGQAQRASGQIAADQRHGKVSDGRGEPASASVQPWRIRARQIERQRRAQGSGAHGGEIAERRRHGPIGHAIGGRGGGEMDVFEHGIGGDHELLPRLQRQHRGIVTVAQNHRVAVIQPREVALDEREFAP